jgi:hypothetical protein
MNELEVEPMLFPQNDTFWWSHVDHRFHQANSKVLELVEYGAIGEIKTIHADFGFSRFWAPMLI